MNELRHTQKLSASNFCNALLEFRGFNIDVDLGVLIASMNTQEAIQKAKTATALASLLGISKSAVSHWGEEMPILRVYQLKALKPSWFKAKSKKETT